MDSFKSVRQRELNADAVENDVGKLSIENKVEDSVKGVLKNIIVMQAMKFEKRKNNSV